MRGSHHGIIIAQPGTHPTHGVLAQGAFHVARFAVQAGLVARSVASQGQHFVHIVLRPGLEQAQPVADGVGLGITNRRLNPVRVEQRIEVATLIEAVADVPEKRLAGFDDFLTSVQVRSDSFQGQARGQQQGFKEIALLPAGFGEDGLRFWQEWFGDIESVGDVALQRWPLVDCGRKPMSRLEVA